MFTLSLFSVGHLDRNHWRTFYYTPSSDQWMGKNKTQEHADKGRKHAQSPTKYNVLGEITKGGTEPTRPL